MSADIGNKLSKKGLEATNIKGSHMKFQKWRAQ